MKIIVVDIRGFGFSLVRKIAEGLNHTVDVIEKRSHIGGNNL